MYTLINSEDIKTYWKKKLDLTDTDFKVIHWKAAQKAFKSVPRGKQRWQLKYMTGHCAVGRMMQIRKEWDHAMCPICGDPLETTRHVLMCKHIRARNQWTISLAKVKQWMEKQETHPDLIQRILAHLQAWVDDVDPPSKGNNIKIRRALMEQESIGWFQFVLGMHTSRFAEIQHQYYISLDKKYTGRRWTTALITKLWDVSWDMWKLRNDVLKKEPHELFTIEATNQADATIDAEFHEGPRRLICRDKHLLRGKKEIKEKTLEQKHLWIETVRLAREAWEAKDADRRSKAAQRDMQQERTLMTSWLTGQPTRPPQQHQTHTPQT
jgi:hypothetical protein